jgi:hypothetical protein
MVASPQAFDLNVEKVLDHWTVDCAVREIIANALDEQAITGTADPVVEKISSNRWRITDFGRGLRYQHLTQNENAEKLAHPAVIGQFGVGLKDALAVFDRHGIGVDILSPFGDISTSIQPKEGFPDVQTLHAIVRPLSDSRRVGTTVILTGIRDADVEAGKSYFLRYNGETVLETTTYGAVLGRSDHGGSANIYIKGVRVAQEDNFLYSYNITNMTHAMRKALNRERANVGRNAYRPRLISILTDCTSNLVARGLADNLAEFATGRMFEEVKWEDVTVHACRALAAHERIVYVTSAQLAAGGAQLEYAVDDGYRLVQVTDVIAHKISGQTDLNGNPIVTFDGYRNSWNESFSFKFVDIADLAESEATVWELTDLLVKSSGVVLSEAGVDKILISDTMRLGPDGDSVCGVFERAERRIVIRRDQLHDPVEFSRHDTGIRECPQQAAWGAGRAVGDGSIGQNPDPSDEFHHGLEREQDGPWADQHAVMLSEPIGTVIKQPADGHRVHSHPDGRALVMHPQSAA